VGLAPRCFINKNAKDFLSPQIEEEFSGHDCKLLGKFSHGLGYTDSVLARALEASPKGSVRDIDGHTSINARIDPIRTAFSLSVVVQLACTLADRPRDRMNKVWYVGSRRPTPDATLPIARLWYSNTLEFCRCHTRSSIRSAIDCYKHQAAYEAIECNCDSVGC